MHLSKHFTLAELTLSATAARAGLDNTPNASALANLKKLAARLEQVRALVGKPVNVTSGYRSPEVNKLVGGSANSAHMLGLAADINVNGYTPRQLAIKIRDSDLMFDQLILEYDNWVHIGLSEGVPRRQLLTIRKGTGYMPGIA